MSVARRIRASPGESDSDLLLSLLAPRRRRTTGDLSPGPTPGFVFIGAGTFTMGSPSSEAGRGSDETQHRVTLTHDFYLQATEVTQEQFQTLMGYNPSYFTKCGTICPVERVSWHEAAAYCNALSSREGLGPCYSCSGTRESTSCTLSTEYETPYLCPGYRLPTEAEWEYAARAGTTAATYGGDPDAGLRSHSPSAVLDTIAWWHGNAGNATRPVGTRQPNAYGLYDMLGNVWEWCHDVYGNYAGTATDPLGPATGPARVLRGGSWYDFAQFCRAADRGRVVPGFRGDNLGFRPARSVF